MPLVTISEKDSVPNSEVDSNEDNVRKITVPSFREEQVNKVWTNNQPTSELIPYSKIITDNLSACVDATLGLDAGESIMFLCVVRKNDVESVMAMCGTPFIGDQEVEIAIPGIKLPKISIVGKKE